MKRRGREGGGTVASSQVRKGPSPPNTAVRDWRDGSDFGPFTRFEKFNGGWATCRPFQSRDAAGLWHSLKFPTSLRPAPRGSFLRCLKLCLEASALFKVASGLHASSPGSSVSLIDLLVLVEQCLRFPFSFPRPSSKEPRCNIRVAIDGG